VCRSHLPTCTGDGVFESIPEQDGIGMRVGAECGEVSRDESLGTPRNRTVCGFTDLGSSFVPAIKLLHCLLRIDIEQQSAYVNWAKRRVPGDGDYACEVAISPNAVVIRFSPQLCTRVTQLGRARKKMNSFENWIF
jgi:hypothetical protein